MTDPTLRDITAAAILIVMRATLPGDTPRERAKLARQEADALIEELAHPKGDEHTSHPSATAELRDAQDWADDLLNNRPVGNELTERLRAIQRNALNTAAAQIAEAALEHRRQQSRDGLRVCGADKGACEDFGCGDLLSLADEIRTLKP